MRSTRQRFMAALNLLSADERAIVRLALYDQRAMLDRFGTLLYFDGLVAPAPDVRDADVTEAQWATRQVSGLADIARDLLAGADDAHRGAGDTDA